jgi:predicted neutral ceramidase superfamily lipid hydrolase
LSQLAAAMGCQAERCSDRLGPRRTRHGDHVLTLDPTSTADQVVRIVTEEKSRAEGQRFGFEAVQKECALARANRDGAAAIFIAESRECLPDGLAFGQIGRCDYFVEYDPEAGDDIGLAAALYLARVAAIHDLKVTGPGPVDRIAARRLVAEVRDRIDRRSRIQAFHGTASKAIQNAAKAVDEDAETILASLLRLDRILSE